MIGATTLRRMRTTMTKVLEGKVAVITGGNSGMGLATAKRFVAEGAHVVITGRRQEQIDIALKEIGSSKAIGVQGDVANMKDLDRLYATVKEKYGHIDILFANAGLANLAPIGHVTEESFDLLINADFRQDRPQRTTGAGVWCQYRAERTDGPHWNPRGNCFCRALPGLKRKQLHLRHRAGSRWRYGASLKQAERSFYENYFDWSKRNDRRTGSNGIGGCWP